MSRRSPNIILRDILRAIEHVQQYTVGHTFASFSVHFMTVEACLYNIQLMGEAVTQLPDDLKNENPHIPWKLIKGMRNRLIHEYFGTDLPVVWNVITEDLPVLKDGLQLIADDLEKPSLP